MSLWSAQCFSLSPCHGGSNIHVSRLTFHDHTVHFASSPFTRLFHCSLANPVMAPPATAVLRALSTRVSAAVFGFSLRPSTAAETSAPDLFTIKELVASPAKKCATSCRLLLGLVAGRTIIVT